MTQTLPSLTDPHAWKRAGAQTGRMNLPRTPGGDAPARTSLRAVWAAELRRERVAFVQATEQLDIKRSNLVRRIHELTLQAKTDPRQASALPTAQEQKLSTDAARHRLHDQFVESVHTLTNDAELCDAAWRSSNELARDRRLVLTATDFTLPAGILALIPDPHT